MLQDFLGVISVEVAKRLAQPQIGAENTGNWLLIFSGENVQIAATLNVLN